MARLCVWVPDELAEVARQQLPGVNMSKILQEGLRARLGCRHDRLVCASCAEPVDHHQLVDEGLGRFYYDLHWRLAELVQRGGTAEGAARVAKDVAERHQVTAAKNLSLPRPTRAERRTAKVKELVVVDDRPRRRSSA